MSIDPAELSGVRRGPLHAGERVTLADMKGHRHTLLLEPGRIFHTTKGALAHDDIIGRPQGIVVSTVGGLEFTVFRPLLHEYTVSMPREAAVIYPKDAAQIVLWADVFPGARVLESGVGSGALSLYLLRAIGPTGTLHSYERRDEFARVALGNVEEFLGGPHPGWTVTVGDLVETIADEPVDRAILDMLRPWDCIDAVAELARYPRPVLLIHGDRDESVPLAASQRAERELRDAELRVIPGAGHGFGDERWETAVSASGSFLAWNGILED